MANRFYTIAREETSNWDAETLARNGIVAAFGLYLVQEGVATHLCEITPSSAAYWVGNRFILESGEYGDWEDDEGLENENGGERWIYTGFVDLEKVDRRFIAGPIEVTEEDLEGGGDFTDPFEVAAELWGQNPDEPGILWDETFWAWQAEQTAKRRAENVPVLSSRGEGVLPLFAAAAMAMLPGGQPTTQTDAMFRQLKWF